MSDTMKDKIIGHYNDMLAYKYHSHNPN